MALDYTGNRWLIHEHLQSINQSSPVYVSQVAQLSVLTPSFSIGNEVLTNLEEGANNWFKSIEIYIALCFHTNRFQKAHELYVNGSTQRNFKNLVPGDRERWTLYSGYLDLFSAMKLLTISESERRSLKSSRIIADMPEAQKDKRGMNISLLTLDIMMRMQQGEHNNPKKIDHLFARIERLSYYQARYLKKENDTFRSDVPKRISIT